METITIELEQDAAEALAQFVKRIGFTECRTLAASENEAYLMQHGLLRIRDALAEIGYAPR